MSRFKSLKNLFKREEKKKEEEEEKTKTSLTTTIKLSPNKFIKATSTEFQMEIIEVKKKNPNLTHLFCMGHDNYWLNLEEEELWRSTFNPAIGKQRAWKQIPEYGVKNLLALGILAQRNYHNPFPRNMHLRKDILRRMSKMLKKIKASE